MQSVSTVPNLKAARTLCHITGDTAGVIQVECEFSNSVSAQSVQQHFRIELPGEVSPLAPHEVTGEDGRFVVGFFSSDIANSGHLPDDCAAIWQTDDGSIDRLMMVSIESATRATARAADADGEAADVAKARYPKTVGFVAMLALLAGVAVIIAFAMAVK